MIDPASASQLAIEGLGICIKVGKLIKGTIENIKNVRADLLALATETERYRNVLGLLKHTAFKDMELGINAESIRHNFAALLALANNVAATDQKSGQLIGGLHWSLKKTEAARLTQRLRLEKADLMEIVGFINATASLRSLHAFEELRVDVMNKEPIIDAFDGLTLTEARTPTTGSLTLVDSSTRKISGTSPSVRTWLGHVITDGFSEQYLQARNRLSDAAYNGEWQQLLDVVEYGIRHYQENWANATRIKPPSQHDNLSFWTPLHQAAFWRAPVEVVYTLIAKGGLCTLRSRSSEFTYIDMTPVELAKKLGYSELVQALTPRIHSPVPRQTLTILESNFHSMIRRDLGERIDREHLYLPVLEVMTELDDDAVWFEVQNHRFANAGYIFRLDGRDLVVRCHHIYTAESLKNYRITQQGITEVIDATLMNE
ncbi:hypothetical protein LTR49_028320 [Elasticomyces elasticus]|nr:hypothetical protein LTR49_028320 [Elasticomyces elasticus]KAK5732009.1 hypothetical protein LTS12_027182 [Elasticomyces elasticus]